MTFDRTSRPVSWPASGTPLVWPPDEPCDGAWSAFARADRELCALHREEQARLLARCAVLRCSAAPFGDLRFLFPAANEGHLRLCAREELRCARRDGAVQSAALLECSERPRAAWRTATELVRAAAEVRAGLDLRLTRALVAACAADFAPGRAEALHVLLVAVRARPRARAHALLGVCALAEGGRAAALVHLRAAHAAAPADERIAHAALHIARPLGHAHGSGLLRAARVPPRVLQRLSAVLDRIAGHAEPHSAPAAFPTPPVRTEEA